MIPVGPLLGAYLLGVAVGLIVAGICAVVWLSNRLDDAVTLPDPRRVADDDTARIDNTNIRDLPRSRQSFEEYA